MKKFLYMIIFIMGGFLFAEDHKAYTGEWRLYKNSKESVVWDIRIENDKLYAQQRSFSQPTEGSEKFLNYDIVKDMYFSKELNCWIGGILDFDPDGSSSYKIRYILIDKTNHLKVSFWYGIIPVVFTADRNI